MNDDNYVLDIQMLGKFQLVHDGIILNDENIRSEMSMKLLAYMLSHRDRNIVASELSEVLWQDDESDNPIGALKNLMYRLRTILKKVYQKDDFIITNRGSYAWNNEIIVNVDVEQFEAYCKKAKQEKNDAKKIILLEKGLHYYHGLFLPILSGEHWVIQLSVYYHSLFLTAVKGLAYLYEQSEQYYKMEALCMDVLQVENLDESIHCLLILSLIKQNKQKLALEHYITTAELLYSQFGTKPSKELQKLYEESLKQTNELEIDLGIIQNDLREASQVKGAFFCEYGVFKRIYNLQARQAKRMGISVYCGLITLKFNYQIAESSDMYIKKMKDAMDGLHTVIDETLRVGDVIARYSVCQYVLLLPTCAYENSITVMERIKKNYAATDKRQRILFHYDVKELTLQ